MLVMPKVIIFHEEGCQPCEEQIDTAERLAETEDFELILVDVIEEWHRARDYNISKLPTVTISTDTGQVIKQYEKKIGEQKLQYHLTKANELQSDQSG